MKRGFSHLDWAISMGIFLVAILSIFIYLKPFSTKLYGNEDLVGIVKEKFNEEAYWTIKKLSLFVGSCSSGQGGGRGRNAKVVLAFENGWKTLDEETSFTTDQTGIYTFYLHNLNRNKEFAVNLRVNPPPCRDEVSLGVVEDTTGISDELVSILSGADYDSLRNLWKFPPGKDFAIFIDQQKIIGGKPYQRANIYAEQIRDFVVSKDGNLREVVISFRVW